MKKILNQKIKDLAEKKNLPESLIKLELRRYLLSLKNKLREDEKLSLIELRNFVKNF